MSVTVISAPEERESNNLSSKSHADTGDDAATPNGEPRETNGQLDGEPSPADPEEREAQNLPLKSYAEAADKASSKDARPRTPNGQRNVEVRDPNERDAQNDQPKSYAEAAEEGASPASENDTPNGPTVNGAVIEPKTPVNGHVNTITEEESTQYEGRGEDSSPKSPTRHGHRRKSSFKSPNGSLGRKGGLELKNEIYEKHQNGFGKPLTSVKPPKEVEKDTPKSDKSRTAQRGLMTGREAGAGWGKSRIRFAPLNVPLQRRLQTLAVLMHTMSIVGLLGVFFMLCSIPLLWPILVPYLIYVLFSDAGTNGKLNHRNERWRSAKVWSLFASYFPARLHRSQELEPTRKYIFGYHPHGIISHGAFAAFATEALGFSQLFPGITNTLLTLDSNFRTPLYREYALRMGLASVSRESIQNILSKGGQNGEGMGRAVTIVVGGARESLESSPGTIRLILRRRKGFVKMAIRTGADLVPVLAFGENEIYQQVDATSHPYLHKFQLLVKKIMGFTVPLFHARGVFNYDVGMMPYRRPLNVVVGRPIRVVQEEHPGKEHVDRVHEEYIKELMRLWDEWKDTFAKERTGELEIIE